MQTLNSSVLGSLCTCWAQARPEILVSLSNACSENYYLPMHSHLSSKDKTPSLNVMISLSNGFAHVMALRERGNDDALSFLLRDEKGKVHMFEKTKIGSARERSASRPNLLETPAGHEVFVKRRYCFAPARRRPIDQLDWGSPAGSRRIARKDGVSKLVQLSLFPPTGGQAKNEENRRKKGLIMWRRYMITKCRGRKGDGHGEPK